MPIVGPCPPLNALTAPPRPQEIEEHLRACVRCRALLKALPPVSGSEQSEAPRPTGSPAPEPGAVYAVRAFGAAERELAFVVDVSEDELDVWPVSEESLLATDADLVLPAHVLGFAAALYPSFAGVVLPEQIEEPLGRVTPADRAAAQAGAPVLRDGDPRLADRAELSERWRAYFEPADAFRGTVTLGELVARGRAVRQLSAAVVADKLGMKEDLISKLEQDELDLVAEVEPTTLARLLDHVAVIPSRKLVARIRQEVIATTPSRAHAAAYRRSGRSARGVDRGHANDYATSVISSLAQIQTAEPRGGEAYPLAPE